MGDSKKVRIAKKIQKALAIVGAAGAIVSTSVTGSQMNIGLDEGTKMNKEHVPSTSTSKETKGDFSKAMGDIASALENLSKAIENGENITDAIIEENKPEIWQGGKDIYTLSDSVEEEQIVNAVEYIMKQEELRRAKQENQQNETQPQAKTKITNTFEFAQEDKRDEEFIELLDEIDSMKTMSIFNQDDLNSINNKITANAVEIKRIMKENNLTIDNAEENAEISKLFEETKEYYNQMKTSAKFTEALNKLNDEAAVRYNDLLKKTYDEHSALTERKLLGLIGEEQFEKESLKIQRDFAELGERLDTSMTPQGILDYIDTMDNPNMVGTKNVYSSDLFYGENETTLDSSVMDNINVGGWEDLDNDENAEKYDVKDLEDLNADNFEL